jgi:hypothetical protein
MAAVAVIPRAHGFAGPDRAGSPGPGGGAQMSPTLNAVMDPLGDMVWYGMVPLLPPVSVFCH